MQQAIVCGMLVEYSLNAHPGDHLNWFWRLRPLTRRLLQLPGLNRLRPLAAKAAAVATPAGQISFQATPSQTPTRDGRTLTILSANLYHDWPRFRRLRQRLEAVAQLIEAETADIVLLQEVARTPQFRSDEWLAHRLGMAYVYARANGHESAIGFEEGLAVFSRFPLAKPVLAELGTSSNPFARRVGIGVEVEMVYGRLPVFSAHLSLTPGQNAVQINHLQQWIGSLVGGRPALIGGDFNAHETSQQIRRAGLTWLDTFRHLHPHADGTTHELRWPWGQSRRRLDYQFLHGESGCWQVHEAWHLAAPDNPHSDHKAVLTRLKNGC